MTATALVRGLGRAGLLVAALSAIGLRAPVADAVVPLATAPPQHVAVVIAGQGSYCTRWHSGMTGADALQAVASVTWGTGPYAGGFVVGINGVMTNPTQKFWSYWHGSGGGWSFSDLGLTTYSVPAGGLEGWSISVTNGARTPPPAASYAAVCAGADAPPPPPPATTAPAAIPPPHATAAPAPRPAPAPVGPATRAGGGTTPPAAGSAAGAAPGGPRSLASSGHAASRGSAGAATSRSPSGPSGSASSATSSAVTLSGSASSTSGPTSVAASPASQATSNAGSSVPVIVGGALGLLLLAAAGAYAWRRSRTG